MPKKKTHEEFVKEMNVVNSNIKILGKYKNARTKIQSQCLIDNYIWDSTPDNLLRGCGCPKCAGKARTTESFQNELYSKGINIKIIDEYVTNSTKVKCKCNIHNVIFYSRPSDILRGKGCFKCKSEKISSKLSITNKEFVYRLFDINNNIEALTPYVNMHTDVIVKCKLCNREWKSKPGNIFSKGIVCKCQQDINASKGELKISQVLDDYGIKYFPQYSFDSLVGVRNGALSYDFYLPDNNLLIEFQGEQHYKPTELFGGKEKFEIQQEHDRRKRNYANIHNIGLLEISYTDYVNIEQILDSVLKAS